MRDLIKQYTDLRTAYDLESAEYERQRVAILAKVQDELDALGSEFTPRLTAASEKFTELEKRIKEGVAVQGKTEKGERWMFVYAKGRVSWDTKKLDGLMLAFPELGQCRSEGEPTVSVRAVK